MTYLSLLPPAGLEEVNAIIDDYVDRARSINTARGIPPGHRHYVRQPNEQTRALWLDILDIAGGVARMTVRQLFYQLVNKGYEKSEKFYKRVDDASIQMRLARVLPFEKFADGSRQRRQIMQYASLGDALRSTHQYYREDLWLSQARRVEVWCEKDALSGFFLPICQQYGVPFVAVRGFSSMSLVSETATEARASDKRTTVLYFGDHDPSGLKMSDNFEEDFSWHEARISVERIALTPDQIESHGLPMRPSKKSDSRTAKFTETFGEGSVELDALPPGVLTVMIEEAIVDHIGDVDEWNAADERAEINKMVLGQFIASLPETA